MKVLGIETSCDETGIAVFAEDQGILSQQLHSQIPVHARYGGVVPELASRDHIARISGLIKDCLADADLTMSDLNAVAYTAGPGLIGALLVGASVGRSLAYALGIPAVPVNHMEAHLLAVLLEEDPPQFPFIALLVSGGHTQLVAVEGVGQYTLLGESLDDAAGEAFDKTAKLLDLGYPGGPQLSALAEKGTAEVYQFPRPMTDRPGLDFSFSGLKTAVALEIKELDDSEQARADLAHAFVSAVVDTLAIKCERAMQETGINRLVAAGGVSANIQLREQLNSLCTERGGKVYFPRPEYCTDNGAMIAYAGFVKLNESGSDDLAFAAWPRWPITANRSAS